MLESYGSNFDHPDIVPVVPLKDNQYMAEQWHGPTASFKDLALQPMARLVGESIAMKNVKRKAEGLPPDYHMVLTATSGDTGKAALEAFRDLPGLFAMAFFPHGKVSKLQELQMTTQEGKNVFVGAMHGDFDAVQKAVKATFADEGFKKSLLELYGVSLTSANSINWGRIAMQIVYHFSAYADLLGRGEIRPNEKGSRLGNNVFLRLF